MAESPKQEQPQQVPSDRPAAAAAASKPSCRRPKGWPRVKNCRSREQDRESSSMHFNLAFFSCLVGLVSATMRVWIAILIFLHIVNWAFSGNVLAAPLTLCLIFQGSYNIRELLPPVILYACCSFLQLVAFVVINIIASATASLNKFMWEENSVTLFSFGIQRAASGNAGRVASSTIPPVCIVLICLTLKQHLVKEDLLTSVILSETAQTFSCCVLCAAGAIVNPSVICFPFLFFAVALLLARGLIHSHGRRTSMTNFIQTATYAMGIPLICAICCAQIGFVSARLGNTPVWLGLREISTIQGGVQLVCVTGAALVAMASVRHEGRGEEKHLLDVKHKHSGARHLMLMQLVHVVQRIVLHFRLFTLMWIAAAFVLLPSLISALMLLLPYIGVTIRARVFKSIIPYAAILMAPLIFLQYLASSGLLSSSSAVVRAALSTHGTNENVLEICATLVTETLLVCTYYNTKIFRSESVSPSRGNRFDKIDSVEALGQTRVARLRSYFTSNDLQEGNFGIEDAFHNLVGRQPTEAERFSIVRQMKGRITVAAAVQLCAQHSQHSTAHHIGSVFWIFFKMYSKFVALVMVFIAATLQRELDVLHAILLGLLLMAFFVPNQWLRLVWNSLFLWMSFLTCTLSVFTAVAPLQDGSEPSDTWRLLGVTKWESKWHAAISFAAFFVVVGERLLLNRTYVSLWEAVFHHEWTQLRAQPVWVTWYCWTSFGMLITVFIFVAMWKSKNLFVVFFLVLILIECTLVAYMKSTTFSRFGILCGTALVMLITTAYQITIVRHRLDPIASKACEGVASASNDTQTCINEIGLERPSGWLTLYFAPWFLAFVAAASHHIGRKSLIRVQEEPMPSNDTTISVELVTRDCESQESMNSNLPRQQQQQLGRDVRALDAASMILNFFDKWVRGFLALIFRRHGIKFQWIALYIACTEHRTVANMFYGLAFVVNAPTLLLLVYSSIHMLALVLYQFVVLPRFTNEHVAEVLGLLSLEYSTVVQIAMGPGLVFVAGVCQVGAASSRKSIAEVTDHIIGKLVTKTAWCTFFAFEAIGFIVCLSIASAVETIVAVPCAFMLFVLMFGGYVNLYTKLWSVISLYCLATTVFLYECFAALNTRRKVIVASSVPQAAYLGIDESWNQPACTCSFIILFFIRCLHCGIPEWRQHYQKLREHFRGHALLTNYIAPPAEITSMWNWRLSKLLGRFVLETAPVAIFTFAEGTGGASAFHLVLLFSGVLLFLFRSTMCKRFAVLWPRCLKTFALLPIVAIILHAPFVSDWISAHQNVMSIVGLYNAQRDRILSFTAGTVVLFTSILLQSHMFEEPAFSAVLQDVDDSDRDKHALALQLSEREDQLAQQEIHQFESQSALLRRTVEHIRQLSATTDDYDILAETLMGTDLMDQLNASMGSASFVFKPEAASTDERPEDDKESNSGVMKKLLRWLSAESLREIPPSADNIVFRLFIAAGWYLQRHTMYVCTAAAVLNVALSATIWDAIPCVAIVGVGCALYPGPPRFFYTSISRFVLSGLVLKVLAAIWARGSEILPQNVHRVSWILTPVDPTAHSVDIMFDFVLYIAVALHFSTPFSARQSEADFLRGKNSPLEISPAVNDHSTRDETSAFFEEEDIYPKEDQIKPDEATGQSFHTWLMQNVEQRHGIGRDLFTWYWSIDVVALTIIIFGYYDIVGSSHHSIVSSVESNILPGPLVAVVTLSLFLMLLDRITYSSHSCTGKLLLNFCVCIAVHVGYIIWNCYNLTLPSVLVLYFAVKCLYSVVSARQVAYNFVQLRQHDPFTKTPESLLSVAGMSVYMSIPYLWELRTLIDWSMSKSRLRLAAWFKLEDLIQKIFDSKANLFNYGPRVTKVVRVLQGWGWTLLIGIALVFPLMFYSSFNPNMARNDVTQIQVQISFPQSIGQFFVSSNFGGAGSVELASSFAQYLSRTRPVLGSYDLDATNRDIQLMSLSSCSTQLWMISPQARELLVESIEDARAGNSQFTINVNLQLSRKSAIQKAATTMSVLQSKWVAPNDALQNLTDMIRDPEKTQWATLRNFFTPFLFNQPSDIITFSSMSGSSTLDKQDCKLRLNSEFDSNYSARIMYWCLECDSLFAGGNNPHPEEYPEEWECLDYDVNCKDFNYENPDDSPKNNTAMYFVIFSDRVPNTITFLPNIGIIAIYATFVLTFSRFVRGQLQSNAAGVVLANMPNTEPLTRLIDFVLFARQMNDGDLERKVHFELVDLLRSPERLLKLTGRN